MKEAFDLLLSIFPNGSERTRIGRPLAYNDEYFNSRVISKSIIERFVNSNLFNDKLPTVLEKYQNQEIVTPNLSVGIFERIGERINEKLNEYYRGNKSKYNRFFIGSVTEGTYPRIREML